MIIVDTREQLPIWQRGIIRLKLEVGDYTTENLHGLFHIERKSPQDLYGTIVQNHVRFRNELIRATIHEIKLVVYVECRKPTFCNLLFPGGSRRKMKPETLTKIVTTIEERYKTEIVWCCSRADLKNKMAERFAKEEKLLFKKSKIKTICKE